MPGAAADEAETLLLSVHAAHIGVHDFERGPRALADLPAMGMAGQRQMDAALKSARQKVRMMRQKHCEISAVPMPAGFSRPCGSACC